MAHTPSNTERLANEAVALLALYLRDGRTRSDLLRQLAEVVVDLRASFETKDGAPDLSGRSHAYRQCMGDVYTRAHVPRDDFDTIQSALRYHVSNLLHERYSTEDLSAAGLSTLPARRRLDVRREAYLALTRDDADAPDLAVLAARAEALLLVAETSAVKDLDPDRAAAARLALRNATDRARVLIRAIDRNFPKG